MKHYSIKTLVKDNHIDPNKIKFYITAEDGLHTEYIDKSEIPYEEQTDGIYEEVKDDYYERFEYETKEEYINLLPTLINKMKELGFRHDTVSQGYFNEKEDRDVEMEYSGCFVW